MLDSDSFVRSFRESYDRLWLVAAAVTGDRSQAEDIVQDAALIAYRKREQFVAGTSFGAWMTQIVRLTAFNFGRKRRDQATRNTDPSQLDQLPEAIRSAQEGSLGVTAQGLLLPDQTAFDDQVVKALQGLAEVPRICVLLRVVRELSYAEIADMLQIPEGTAMSHVHRAKQVLRDQLRDYRSSRIS